MRITPSLLIVLLSSLLLLIAGCARSADTAYIDAFSAHEATFTKIGTQLNELDQQLQEEDYQQAWKNLQRIQQDVDLLHTELTSYRGKNTLLQTHAQEVRTILDLLTEMNETITPVVENLATHNTTPTVEEQHILATLTDTFTAIDVHVNEAVQAMESYLQTPADPNS